MAVVELTIEDLRTILRTAAGEDGSVDLDGDILNMTFEQLGYDSLALLETCGCVEREHGIELDDSTIADADTPQALLVVINAQLAAQLATH
jgi:act minimal PKS acyl carrier protein